MANNPTLFNRRLGAAVRARRIVAGMTQADVGAALGVTYQQLQKYEVGCNRLSVEKLVSVAQAIGTTPHELLETATSEEAPIEQSRDRMALEIARRIADLSPERQRIARNVIKALAAEEAA